MTLLDVILGRRLANREQGARKIGWFEGVPAMGLDGLGSSSYGPEAALTVLMPLGAAGTAWIGAIMVPIIILLAILYLSYRQTIAAYPVDGGAYVVAKENLGRNAGLLAAAALMIDYVLNVAVGISAGVGALTSSIPLLQPYTLALCLGILILITGANLRGTKEAGWLFSLPTYVFLIGFLGLILAGLLQMAATGGHPHPVIPAPAPQSPTQTVTLWLLIRAFAAGCTAMTGVEAVSNGVRAFREPVAVQARRTLSVICLALGLLLAGIAALIHGYGLAALDQAQPGYRSVLSQFAAAVAGHGGLFDLCMASLLAVLCLSANTSFVGFPRLCKLVAQDGFLPRSFAIAGRRLAFSAGIGFLAVTAGALLIVFGGITDRLIPLFAIGAFLTFTLSQFGMVVHWRKSGRKDSFAINAIGGSATAAALLVIFVAKFVDGAWIVALAIPASVMILDRIGCYHTELDRRLLVSTPFLPDETEPPVVLVAMEDRSRMTDAALAFAMTLSPDVIAVHLLRLQGPEMEEGESDLKRRWRTEVEQPLQERGLGAPRLVLLPAPHRQIHGPLLELINKLDIETPGRSVAVLIPELVLTRWWERLLHPQRGKQLEAALLRHGGPRVKVILSPWRSFASSSGPDSVREGKPGGHSAGK